MIKVIAFMCILIVTGCATTKQSTFEQVGGMPKIEEIVDNFITEIERDPIMFEFFKDSNIDRFREKLIEHMCYLTGGQCEYTGDSMEQVHGGMNITESYFNHSVDLFINAMNKAGIPHPVQNKVLAVLAPTRKEMLYL
ncbi:group 1 truncated hemoglobin [Oceanicoccus sp. KOV_DT_Chl]|uniref:group I truncated hemoglobin n=1 Tax=Oceanicoccus sp. KOV_DT_Chl TaxID=1904639 RepID=UPI00190ED64B|nr:group 1 truncated hemoglobin [Oceanicoccus sp. KOV_DT_Chl]